MGTQAEPVFAELGLGEYPGLLHNLGYVALASGDKGRAAASFEAALGLFRRVGDWRGSSRRDSRSARWRTRW